MNWLVAQKRDADRPPWKLVLPKASHVLAWEEPPELAYLKCDLACVDKERDFLIDAAAYFAWESCSGHMLAQRCGNERPV